MQPGTALLMIAGKGVEVVSCPRSTSGRSSSTIVAIAAGAAVAFLLFTALCCARSWSHGASSERGLSCTARTRTSVCFRSIFHARNERPSEAAYTLPTRAPLRPAVAQSSKGDTQQQPAAGAALPPSGDLTSSEASAEPSAELPVSPSINFRFGAIGVLQMRKDLSPRQVPRR